jgi:hypothetical protein
LSENIFLKKENFMHEDKLVSAKIEEKKDTFVFSLKMLRGGRNNSEIVGVANALLKYKLLESGHTFNGRQDPAFKGTFTYDKLADVKSCIEELMQNKLVHSNSAKESLEKIQKLSEKHLAPTCPAPAPQ